MRCPFLPCCFEAFSLSLFFRNFIMLYLGMDFHGFFKCLRFSKLQSVNFFNHYVFLPNLGYFQPLFLRRNFQPHPLSFFPLKLQWHKRNLRLWSHRFLRLCSLFLDFFSLLFRLISVVLFKKFRYTDSFVFAILLLSPSLSFCIVQLLYCLVLKFIFDPLHLLLTGVLYSFVLCFFIIAH